MLYTTPAAELKERMRFPCGEANHNVPAGGGFDI